MNLRPGLLSLLALGAPAGAHAQSPPVKRAAETITAADIRRRIFLIADDSMGGRNTPSPGLTRTAEYIAGEFRRFGLKPGGDSGSFLLNYPIVVRQILADRSQLNFTQVSGAERVTTTLALGAAYLSGATSADVKGGVVLLGGVVQADSLKPEDFKDRIVVYVPGAGTRPGRAAFRLYQHLGALGARGVVVVVNSDSLFGFWSANQGRPRMNVGDVAPAVPVVAIREATVLEQSPGAQDQFNELRAATGTVVNPLPDWEGAVTLRDTVLSAESAPDVVGILEGSDPVLKSEYVVFSAHMDHIGTAGQPGAQCRPAGADSICNGADDDGSGTVGVVELAQAFTRSGARPRRSIIFLTVSGEEHGLWGSDWFVNHPPVPLPRIVADLNADMIGRNWKDTIVAIGKEHSDLGATLNRVNSAHPELHMHAVDDRWPEENFYQRSDHYNFARKGVPILFFFNGVHADYHQATDSPDKIDAEKESRIVKLLFYLGQAVANAPERPKWVAESYKEIVQP